MDNRTRIIIWAIAGPIIGFGIGFMTPSNPRQNYNVAGFVVESDHIEFRSSVRKLFENYVFWNRQLIQNIADGSSEEKDITTGILLSNAKNMSDEIMEPYFNKDDMTKMNRLMEDHFAIQIELIESIKADDSSKIDEARQKWARNADKISVLLGELNPHWSEKIVKHMLHEYLRLTEQEAVDIINKDRQSAAKDYDKIREQTLMIADVISSGIIKRFPASH